jgi:hypothetical protein
MSTDRRSVLPRARLSTTVGAVQLWRHGSSPAVLGTAGRNRRAPDAARAGKRSASLRSGVPTGLRWWCGVIPFALRAVRDAGTSIGPVQSGRRSRSGASTAPRSPRGVPPTTGLPSSRAGTVPPRRSRWPAGSPAFSDRRSRSHTTTGSSGRTADGARPSGRASASGGPKARLIACSRFAGSRAAQARSGGTSGTPAWASWTRRRYQIRSEAGLVTPGPRPPAHPDRPGRRAPPRRHAARPPRARPRRGRAAAGSSACSTSPSS